MKIMKTMIPILLVMLCLALMAGCSKVTRENYDQIKMGMAMDEVITLIGEPDSCSGALGAKKCVWGDETQNITIAFVGDHVTLPSMQGL